MADLGLINASDLPDFEERDFSPIPPGEYTAMIVESEIKTTKSGEMLVLVFEILDTDYKGRKVWNNLNIRNSSTEAEKIALAALKQVMTAVGKLSIKKSEELHNKRVKIDVTVRPGRPYEKDGKQYDGNPSNDIKNYHALVGTASTSGVAGTPAATGPWAKKAS